MTERRQLRPSGSYFLVATSATILLSVATVEQPADAQQKNVRSQPEPCFLESPPAWCGSDSSSKSNRDSRSSEQRYQDYLRIRDEMYRAIDRSLPSGAAPTNRPSAPSGSTYAPYSGSGGPARLQQAMHIRNQAQLLENAGHYAQASSNYWQAHNLFHSSDPRMGEETLIGHIRMLHTMGNSQAACQKLNHLFDDYATARRMAHTYRSRYGCEAPGSTASTTAATTAATAAQRAEARKSRYEARKARSATGSPQGGFRDLPNSEAASSEQSLHEPKNSDGKNCIQITQLSVKKVTGPIAVDKKWEFHNICGGRMVATYVFGNGPRRASYISGGSKSIVACYTSQAPCNLRYTWKLADAQ